MKTHISWLLLLSHKEVPNYSNTLVEVPHCPTRYNEKYLAHQLLI